MTLEELVPDRKLCEEWKRIGGRQDTALYWVPNYYDKWEVVLGGSIVWKTDHKPDIAAPTAGELMEWLRNEIDCVWPTAEFWNWRDNSEHSDYDESLPNALMQMAIEKEGKDG